MKKTIMINGGGGRVICAIPALERFIESNPDSLVLVNYWTPILWGNSKIQSNVFDDGTKGIFNLIKDTKIISPEPYFNNNYLNAKINLIQAFDEEINGSSNNDIPKLFLSKEETIGAHNSLINHIQGRKIIGFQPFGSTAVFVNDSKEVIDQTSRSLSVSTAVKFIEKFSKEFCIVVFCSSQFIHIFEKYNVVIVNESANIRMWIAFVNQLNYIVGIDSLCQHIARAFNIPGTVFIGGTDKINISYPEWFQIIEKDKKKIYNPYRFASFDSYLANLNNSDLLTFDHQETKDIFDKIHQNIKRNTK